MSELLLISSLGGTKEGMNLSAKRQPWLTLQQYFDIPEASLGGFTSRVGQAVEAFSPIEIEGLEDDFFGEKNDTLVRRVQALGGAATLRCLHTVLAEVITHSDGEIRNPEWAFEGYNPHVTYIDGRALAEGEVATLQTVELVGKDPVTNDKIIQKVWQLEP